ncbi:MAG: phosphate signaling complex protein PhoU [Candidatus Limnocylindria bacterium]
MTPDSSEAANPAETGQPAPVGPAVAASDPTANGGNPEASADDAPAARSSTRATLDTELRTIKDDVLRLGALVEVALERAGRAVFERNAEVADQVRWDDAEVNDLQRRVSNEIAVTLATQQPMARDLRELLALYHAAAELERMGDYAVNIAKLAQQLASEPEIPMFGQIPLMERLCRSQLHAAMRALVDVSEADARAVCANDDELDRLYDAVYRSAMELMQADPSRVPQATHLLFIAHHLERLGDRVTNIGEDVVYLATGQIEDLN